MIPPGTSEHPLSRRSAEGRTGCTLMHPFRHPVECPRALSLLIIYAYERISGALALAGNL